MTFTEQEKAILSQAETILRTKMVRSDCFNGAASVKLYLQTKLADLTTEVFGALFLDSQHQLIEDMVLFYGTVNGCSVYPRILVENSQNFFNCLVLLCNEKLQNQLVKVYVVQVTATLPT